MTKAPFFNNRLLDGRQAVCSGGSRSSPYDARTVPFALEALYVLRLSVAIFPEQYAMADVPGTYVKLLAHATSAFAQG